MENENQTSYLPLVDATPSDLDKVILRQIQMEGR